MFTYVTYTAHSSHLAKRRSETFGEKSIAQGTTEGKK
jgi:hypothetical protein